MKAPALTHISVAVVRASPSTCSSCTHLSTSAPLCRSLPSRDTFSRSNTNPDLSSSPRPETAAGEEKHRGMKTRRANPHLTPIKLHFWQKADEETPVVDWLFAIGCLHFSLSRCYFDTLDQRSFSSSAPEFCAFGSCELLQHHKQAFKFKAQTQPRCSPKLGSDSSVRNVLRLLPDQDWDVQLSL